MSIERSPLPEGATLVETIPYQLTRRLLREILPRRGALEVTGRGGTGKTFTVDDYFARNPALDLVKIHLEAKVRGNGFLRRLVEELGGKPDPSWDGQRLMKELRALVGPRRLYVYVDEADLLNRDSLRQIRYLRDQRDLHIAWVLVGTTFANAYRLVPELWSRVTRRVTFDSLAGDALTGALAAYHPFLAAADPAILARIDEEHCQGNWRVWSEVLPDLLDYAARLETDGLTTAVAAAVLGVTVDRNRAKPKRGGPVRPARRKAAQA